MKIKIATILLMVLPAYAYSEVYWPSSPHTVDARSVAMGRTSIVSATGSNSIFSNPGTIATLDSSQGQAGGRVIMEERDNENPYYEGIATETWSIEKYSWDSKLTPHFSINHLSVSMPYKLSGISKNSDMDLAVGVGYRTYFDWGIKARSFMSSSSTSNSAREELTVNGGLNVITPTIAINLQDKYYVGATFNKSIFGTITINSEYINTEGRALTQNYHVEHSASFFKFGGLAKVNEQLTLGFSFTPEFKWKWGKMRDLEGGESPRETVTHVLPSITGFGATYQFSPTLWFC